MFAGKRPPQKNLKLGPMSSRHRFFYYSYEKIKRLTKAGLITASLFIPINGFAETGAVSIKVHMRVVAAPLQEESGISADRGTAVWSDPPFLAQSQPQGDTAGMMVRMTVVEGASYSEIIPYSP